MSTQPVLFVWPGDLHLEFPDRPNVKVAHWMAEEVNELIRPDFVQFAGDNVQHAQPPEWELFKAVWSKLKAPFHALVGDHDAHQDPGAYAYQANLGVTYQAYTVHGWRFICLNTMQFKPLGMKDEQVHWFRYEVDAALSRGEKVVVFQHHYPFQILEDFLTAPGMAVWREIIQTRPIHALFAGHTHYGQIANDCHLPYIAVRSIGEPEGGPAGYAVVHLNGEELAIGYRSVEDRGPLALITHPRKLILATKTAHIVTGPLEGRVRAWSKVPVVSAKMRIDDGAWSDLSPAGETAWSFRLPGDTLAKGEHRLEVVLTDAEKAEGKDALTFLCDRSGRFNPYPMVEPVVKHTKFC